MTVEQYRQEIREELEARLNMLKASKLQYERTYRRIRQSGIDISYDVRAKKWIATAKLTQEERDERQAEYDLHHPELVDPMKTEK